MDTNLFPISPNIIDTNLFPVSPSIIDVNLFPIAPSIIDTNLFLISLIIRIRIPIERWLATYFPYTVKLPYNTFQYNGKMHKARWLLMHKLILFMLVCG